MKINGRRDDVLVLYLSIRNQIIICVLPVFFSSCVAEFLGHVVAEQLDIERVLGDFQKTARYTT
jgi:hypothetical protein